MIDIDKARQLFRDAGLSFPAIPKALAVQLKERSPWVFSTRPLKMSPYNLQHYEEELERTLVKDYAVLAHSGHGANSYAIQYYLPSGERRRTEKPLEALTQALGWITSARNPPPPTELSLFAETRRGVTVRVVGRVALPEERAPRATPSVLKSPRKNQSKSGRT